MTDMLDLTNAHLSDDALEEVLVPDNLKNLDLTANRLKQIDSRILKLTGLQSLSFRQNLLQDASVLSELQSASGLEQLILHDNHLTQLPPLSNLAVCQHLEVSYNSIRSMEGLRELPTSSLKHLYAACNKIQHIQGLEAFTDLRTLELGGNRIREIQGLESLQKLEELWLGRNRLESISNLDRLTSLKQLSVQSNRLTSIAGLEGCTTLQELYVSHNGIKTLKGLEGLTELRLLDAANNQLEKAEGLGSMTRLEDLWLNDNQLEDPDAISADLQGLKESLTCVYLSGNPMVKILGSQYKSWLRMLMPNLQQIDADIVS